MEAQVSTVLSTLFIAIIWLSIGFKTFRFDKLASNIFYGALGGSMIIGLLLAVFGSAVGMIAYLAILITGDERIGFYIGLSVATILAGVWGYAVLSGKFGWDDLMYLVREDIPERIRDFFKIKVDRETEKQNTALVVKLANYIIAEEKSSSWYYFLATVFFIATYLVFIALLPEYGPNARYLRYQLEGMDWWKKIPLLLTAYAAFMLLYRLTYRARFIKTPFAKIVTLLEALNRDGQHMVFYDHEDGEHYGVCLLQEKPDRYPSAPRWLEFVDIGDGELGYLLTPTMDYEVFRRAYLNISNRGVRGYLDWLAKESEKASTGAQ